MVFHPHSWLPQVPEGPDSVTVEQFLADEKHGRCPVSRARNPFTCGLSGKSYAPAEIHDRADLVSRALAKRLAFDPADGTEWDRVVCLYSLNTIDYVPVAHAVHRASGIVTAASASYEAGELEHQLRTSGSKAVFTNIPLLDTALKAARAAGIPEENVFVLPIAGADNKVPQKTVDDLVEEGTQLAALAPLKLGRGQGKRRVAFLMYSSGTSGLPKAVMLSHHNVISNILQAAALESVARKKLGIETQVMLGLLPFGHIFALVLIAHLSVYRGDEVTVLPKFDFGTFLNAIQTYKIEQLVIVPPILVQMAIHREKCAEFDLRSVRAVFSGAAPLGEELIATIRKHYAGWNVVQGYGMTESSPLATLTSELDVLPGSSGVLVPNIKAKVIDADGREVTGYEQRGELLLQGANVVLGYLNNEKANAETFVWHDDGRWLRTGDEVLVRKAPSGDEHFFIVDRIKELIKVKGYQVAPAELEAHLLAHPDVDDCAVIGVDDDRAGEVPKAFVVKTASSSARGRSDAQLRASINKHVEDAKPRYKWLKGGIEFMDVIPKSPSGKILRRILKDKERAARRNEGAKL